MFPFYNPKNIWESFWFLVFSGVIKYKHCPEMGQADYFEFEIIKIFGAI